MPVPPYRPCAGHDSAVLPVFGDIELLLFRYYRTLPVPGIAHVTCFWELTSFTCPGVIALGGIHSDGGETPIERSAWYRAFLRCQRIPPPSCMMTEKSDKNCRGIPPAVPVPPCIGPYSGEHDSGREDHPELLLSRIFPESIQYLFIILSA